MVPLTLAEVAEAVGGRLDGADPAVVVRSVVTDSRHAEEGALFVALEGERADGHDFVADALDRGAAAALVNGRVLRGALVRTEDPLAALAALAAAVRPRLRATVIAITGSSGKTCTKDLTAAALAAARRVVAAPASHNNEIGVPLTILAAGPDTEALVVEVGSRGAGHIGALVPVIRPDIAVVTNVGRAHIGMFGSIEATAEAKAELVDGLGTDGLAVLNGDDPLVAAMASRAEHVVTFGLGADAVVRAEGVALDAAARASFTLVAGTQRAAVALRLTGAHMVPNALAAAAAARAAGASLSSIADGLSTCDPPPWRMEVIERRDGVRIVNDAYNANPDSVAAALDALVAMGQGGTTWAVLGHMAELGEAAPAEHERVGRDLVRAGVDRLVVVGADATPIADGALAEGMPRARVRRARDVDEASAAVRAGLEPGAVVLVKASRAAGLERLARALEAGA